MTSTVLVIPLAGDICLTLNTRIAIAISRDTVDGVTSTAIATGTNEELANNNHDTTTTVNAQECNSDGYEAPSDLPAQAFAKALYPFKGEYGIYC